MRVGHDAACPAPNHDGPCNNPAEPRAEGLRDHEYCVPHDHVEPDMERWERDQAAALALAATPPQRAAPEAASPTLQRCAVCGAYQPALASQPTPAPLDVINDQGRAECAVCGTSVLPENWTNHVLGAAHHRNMERGWRSRRAYAQQDTPALDKTRDGGAA
jgi:hypothetical protein